MSLVLMTRIERDQTLIPSILDRLLDDEPDNPREPPRNRHQILRELKQSVRRDLQNLLNSRWRCVEWPPDLDHLDTSLVNYGIPDFTGIQFSAARAREQLRRTIEAVVQRFEPRFQRVRVELLSSQDSIDRRIRFRIDALLYAEPAPEPVVFDTIVETTTGDFEVKGASG